MTSCDRSTCSAWRIWIPRNVGAFWGEPFRLPSRVSRKMWTSRTTASAVLVPKGTGITNMLLVAPSRSFSTDCGPSPVTVVWSCRMTTWLPMRYVPAGMRTVPPAGPIESTAAWMALLSSVTPSPRAPNLLTEISPPGAPSPEPVPDEDVHAPATSTTSQSGTARDARRRAVVRRRTGTTLPGEIPGPITRRRRGGERRRFLGRGRTALCGGRLLDPSSVEGRLDPPERRPGRHQREDAGRGPARQPLGGGVALETEQTEEGQVPQIDGVRPPSQPHQRPVR